MNLSFLGALLAALLKPLIILFAYSRAKLLGKHEAHQQVSERLQDMERQADEARARLNPNDPRYDGEFAERVRRWGTRPGG